MRVADASLGVGDAPGFGLDGVKMLTVPLLCILNLFFGVLNALRDLILSISGNLRDLVDQWVKVGWVSGCDSGIGKLAFENFEFIMQRLVDLAVLHPVTAEEQAKTEDKQNKHHNGGHLGLCLNSFLLCLECGLLLFRLLLFVISLTSACPDHCLLWLFARSFTNSFDRVR